MSKRTYRNLIEYMQSTGTTQAELGRKVGCHQALISKIARGAQNPSFRLALRISMVARVPIESLMPGGALAALSYTKSRPAA